MQSLCSDPRSGTALARSRPNRGHPRGQTLRRERFRFALSEAVNRMDNWVEQARASSLQVRVAQAALDIAMQDVSKNRTGHLPTLDAVASYTDPSADSGLQGGSGIDSTTKYIGRP